ncbi:MAG: DUF1461 domain-containing protein [Eubacteriales bacterium]|nr:DUF1461 domain-containing protein [Eubacteriales bacterium]
MKKKLSVCFAAAGTVCLLAALTLFAVASAATNRDFYYNRYMEDKTADSLGIYPSELNRALADMMRFVNGHDDTALDASYTFTDDAQRPLWTNSEKIWLSDLRDFIDACRTVQWILIAVGTALLIAGVAVSWKKPGFRILGRTYIAAAVAFGFVFLAVGLWALSDINGVRLALDGLIFPGGTDFIDGTLALSKMFSIHLFYWEFVHAYLLAAVCGLLLSGLIYAVSRLGAEKKEDDDVYLYQ